MLVEEEDLIRGGGRKAGKSLGGKRREGLQRNR